MSDIAMIFGAIAKGAKPKCQIIFEHNLFNFIGGRGIDRSLQKEGPRHGRFAVD